MSIAILTSPNQWFCSYVEELSRELGNVPVYYSHKDIEESYMMLFILSYHNIIEKEILAKNLHNLVIHESNLPQGKGWAPLFWQILEGKQEVTVSMIEATEGVDSGPIYMQKIIRFSGHELNKEIRTKQARIIIDMCVEFSKHSNKFIPPIEQSGKESFYPKRTPKDSRLDPSKSIIDQFNLLRIVDNEFYPAFFEIDGRKYILKIEDENND